MKQNFALRDELRRRLYELYAARHMRGEPFSVAERSAKFNAFCAELGIGRVEALRAFTDLRNKALTQLQARGLISRRVGSSAVVWTAAGIRQLLAQRNRLDVLEREKNAQEHLRDAIADLNFDASLEHLGADGRERVAYPIGLSNAQGEAPLALGQADQAEDERLRAQARAEQVAYWQQHPGYLGQTEDPRNARP